MKHEKTQKGNPHKLTINQHCFPARSIERFTDSSKRVDVFLKQKNIRFKEKPSGKIFCARRAWDQRAESGFMKDIEDEYQALASHVHSGVVTSINQMQQTTISKMFALWNIRWHWAKNPISDQDVKGVDGVTVEFGKDEEEQLEKAGITVMRPDLTISGRHFTGANIQANLDSVLEQLDDAQWGILTCMEGEFIVPDTVSSFRYLPLSPNKCFFSSSDDAVISYRELNYINQQVKSDAKDFYFAKTLDTSEESIGTP